MRKPGRIRQELKDVILKSPIWLKLGSKVKCNGQIHVFKQKVKISYPPPNNWTFDRNIEIYAH